MVEYATFVGTLLHRDAQGDGEREWSATRTLRWRRVWEAGGQGVEAYCNVVIKEILAFVADGSEFYQYGNCGEGGAIGACLAVKAGFNPSTEIRKCESDNDHAFAMVKHEDPSKKWCILDRWAIARDGDAGFFSCGVDWDQEARVVTVDGVPSTAQWFQKVTCTSLKNSL